MIRRYDLQVHTDSSPCSTMNPETVVNRAITLGLDGVAVTDHDTLEGARRVAELAPPRLEVVMGVEVTTTHGHILALDVYEEPPQANPLEVIDHIHSQDGYAVLSHPFDRLREHCSYDLDAIAGEVDAVEAVNSRCVSNKFNRRALEFAKKHGLPVTGGSDAHFPFEIGRAYTESRKPLTEALETGELSVGGRGGYLSGHLFTKTHDLISAFR